MTNCLNYAIVVQLPASLPVTRKEVVLNKIRNAAQLIVFPYHPDETPYIDDRYDDPLE